MNRQARRPQAFGPPYPFVDVDQPISSQGLAGEPKYGPTKRFPTCQAFSRPDAVLSTVAPHRETGSPARRTALVLRPVALFVPGAVARRVALSFFLMRISGI